MVAIVKVFILTDILVTIKYRDNESVGLVLVEDGNDGEA